MFIYGFYFIFLGHFISKPYPLVYCLLTLQQLDEMQIISCQSATTAGSFVLKYKEQLSPPISAAATTADVMWAIESIVGIKVVAVDIVLTGNPNQLCTTSGNQFSVTFLTEHGALPLMTLTSQFIDQILITQQVQGTKEWDECSGRGICNRVTGLCACFTGYGSSNGQGGMGTLGDCGYIEPIVLVSAVA